MTTSLYLSQGIYLCINIAGSFEDSFQLGICGHILVTLKIQWFRHGNRVRSAWTNVSAMGLQKYKNNSLSRQLLSSKFTWLTGCKALFIHSSEQRKSTLRALSLSEVVSRVHYTHRTMLTRNYKCKSKKAYTNSRSIHCTKKSQE